MLHPTLYTTPLCTPCKLHVRKAVEMGVGDLLAVVDITTDPEAHAEVLALGHQRTPVFVVRDDDGTILDHWSQYQPLKFNALLGALVAQLEEVSV